MLLGFSRYRRKLCVILNEGKLSIAELIEGVNMVPFLFDVMTL